MSLPPTIESNYPRENSDASRVRHLAQANDALLLSCVAFVVMVIAAGGMQSDPKLGIFIAVPAFLFWAFAVIRTCVLSAKGLGYPVWLMIIGGIIFTLVPCAAFFGILGLFASVSGAMKKMGVRRTGLKYSRQDVEAVAAVSIPG